jgi:hypothetical protein
MPISLRCAEAGPAWGRSGCEVSRPAAYASAARSVPSPLPDGTLTVPRGRLRITHSRLFCLTRGLAPAMPIEEVRVTSFCLPVVLGALPQDIDAAPQRAAFLAFRRRQLVQRARLRQPQPGPIQ